MRINKFYHIFLLLMLLMSVSDIACALTPAQVLDRSASALLKSKGVTANYTLSSSGQRQSGEIKAKGKKFYISAGGVQTWFDGATQWNYSPKHQEVTISRPTAAEIASASPYALVSSYKSNYTLSSLKSSIAGTYAIALKPKSKSNPVKQAVIYVRSSDFQPCRLDMVARNGTKSSIIITSIKTGVNLPDVTFVFPAKQYPKAEIIDLR